MALMTYQQLRSCTLRPSLVDWLADRLWERTFMDSYIQRGESYARQGRVREVAGRADFLRSGSMVARVDGSRPQPYEVNLRFYPATGRGRARGLELEALCSCPVAYHCKHCAAVLVELSGMASAPDLDLDSGVGIAPELQRWLGELQALDAPPEPKKKATKDFLAYCIERSYSGELGLRLHRASPGGRGPKIHDSDARADPTNPPAYMGEEDYPLIVRFRQLAPQHWDPVVPLDREGVGEILLGALELDALFCDMESTRDQSGRVRFAYERVLPGPELRAEPGWASEPDGSVRPVVEVRDMDGEPVGGDPQIIGGSEPLYLDPSGPRLGRLASDLPGGMLNHWRCGPVLEAAQVDAASDVLEGLGGRLPAPVTTERVELPRSAPHPHLHIRPGEREWALTAIVGDLKFRYADHPLVEPLGPGDPPVTTWREGDRRLVLHRDQAAESRFGQRLQELGLEAIEALVYDPPEDLERCFVWEDGSLPPTLAWILFLEQKAPELREDGWTIEVDPALDLSLREVDDFEAELEPETEHGIDWFRLDLQIEVDGQRVSLIPVVAELIEAGVLEEDGPELGDYLVLPVPPPGSGFVRVPTARLLELCRSVGHLLGGRDPDEVGPLQVDRLAAAGVADELDLDDSETLRALADLGRKLRDIDGLPATAPPKALQAELRPYQLDGFRWLQFLADHQLHGILADDMGLGKTVQTLARLASGTGRNAGPSLVVAPTSVVGNWALEAARFTPKLKVILLHGPERHERFEHLEKADLVLTSYALLARDRERLLEQDWNTVVLDEAQYIKNPKTVAAKTACALKARHRLCLSGTPLENHLGELWSLMRFLMPGFLPDEKTFNSRIRRPIERDRDAAAQEALVRRVSPLILRRTKDEVATDLPEKTEIIHRVTLSARELDLYESVRALMDKRVREALAAKGLGKSHIIVLDALLKLRQVCCHPSLLKTPAAATVKDAAKFSFLTKELLPTLLEEGRRILLFSSFTTVLGLIEEELKKAGVAYLKLTGRTRKRAPLLQAFQNGEAPVFLISLKAGGTGLNLTAADTVIHYDPWWNPAAENQATDRAHRIGQDKPVFVHKLICEGTIEDRILELQAHKARLVQALFSGKGDTLRLDESTLSALLAPLE